MSSERYSAYGSQSGGANQPRRENPDAQAAGEGRRAPSARQNTGRQQAVRQNTGRQQAVRQNTGRQQAVRQNTGRQQAVRQNTGRQEAVRQNTGRQEAVRQNTGRQQAVRQNTGRHPAVRNGGGQGPFWRRIPAKARLAVFAVLVVAVVFCAVKLIAGGTGADEERFVDNVYINGVALGGMTREEGYETMNSLRDTWLSTTYTLTYEGRTWDFRPADVNAHLDFESELERAWNLGHVGDRATRRQIVEGLREVPAEFVSQPTYDETAMDAFVTRLAGEINTDPVDAEVTLTQLKPVITQPSQNGLKLDEDQLEENLVTLIETGEGDTVLPVEEIQPTVVSDNMEMGMIARFETDVSFRGYDSRSNVRVALEHFNLLAVYPGETVSFNEIVGPRTEAAGFKEAPEYAGSNTEMGIGGGVCQASTTLYNAAIQAGMTIIQRHRHTMTVTYVEPSQDAAVSYGQKDFVFRNDTEHAIYIYTNVTKELATVIIYGTRPEYHYELESVILHEAKSDRTGYQDDVEGTHVYYVTDPPKLYKEGRGSCESEGWIVAYDWNTKEEVSRVQVNHDIYTPGVNVYWRGVHYADGSVATH